MRYFAVGISVLALVIVLAYVRYYEKKSKNYLTRYEVLENSQFPDKVNARTISLPEQLSFAGEEVPLDRPQVRERLYRELLVNTYWHSNTLLMIVEANRWLPQIENILIKNGIPSDFKYIPVIEGSLRNDISPAGAVGFWQLLEGTGKEFGLEIREDVDERYDPLKSTEAAADYLAKSYNRFNNWTNVAASYNRGMAGLDRALESQKANSYYDLYLNDETARYVYRILAIKLILENPAQYGFLIDDEHLYEAVDLKEYTIEETIKDLPAYVKELGYSYGTLRHYNPWIRDYSITVPEGESYIIQLPEQEEL